MSTKLDRRAPFHQDFAGRLRALADEVDRGDVGPKALRTLDAIKLVLLGATIPMESAHRVGRMTLLGAIDYAVSAKRDRAIDYAHAVKATGGALTDVQERLLEQRGARWSGLEGEWATNHPEEAASFARRLMEENLKRGPTMTDLEVASEVRWSFAWPFVQRTEDGEGLIMPELLPGVSDDDLLIGVAIWSARGAPRRTTARPEKWPFLAELCARAGLGRVTPEALATDWQDWTGSGFRPKPRRRNKD